MTDMQNLEKQLSEKERQEAVYQRAMDSLARQRNAREKRGWVTMAAADTYGRGALGSSLFGKLSRAAALFCITFAFLLPSLLLARFVL